jgi:cob(I)alamin adenosyltransferase
VKQGYTHIYTGDGKGKTTAAFGMALRASGAGLRVFIGQFVKGMDYHEILAVREHPHNITIRQYGRDCFIVNTPTQEDINAARMGLEEMRNIIMEGKYDMVIMDEVNIALHYKLFDMEEVVEVIKQKPLHVELILTGRYAPRKLFTHADLVSEIKEVKHYYKKGIEARKGIEY